MPGWAQSEGLLIEINAAEDLGVGITYLEPAEKFIGLTPEQSVELHRRYVGADLRRTLRKGEGHGMHTRVRANYTRLNVCEKCLHGVMPN